MALVQHTNRFFDAALAGFGGFGLVNCQDVPLFVTEGQPFKELPGFRVAVEGGGKVRRHSYFSRRGIQFEVYFYRVTGGDPGPLAVLGAERQHELAAQGCYGAAVGVTPDSNSHSRALARTQAFHHLRWNRDAGSSLAAQQDSRMKFHANLSLTD
jgi:hypothetical protein